MSVRIISVRLLVGAVSEQLVADELEPLFARSRPVLQEAVVSAHLGKLDVLHVGPVEAGRFLRTLALLVVAVFIVVVIIIVIVCYRRVKVFFKSLSKPYIVWNR